MKNDNFQEIYHVFDVVKVMTSNTIWLNSNQNDLYITINNFGAKFSYAIENSHCFQDIEFNQSDKVMMSAEQYGGSGIGANGGGVRCGNLEGYQIKGIGVNQVVGTHDNFDHSSGMYPLFEAVTEAINSCVYSTVLPEGVVNYYGIIAIGESHHALAPEKAKQQLALGVRDACIRPAHFMRAAFFKPKEENKHLVVNDVVRVRALNKTLKNNFETDNHFIQHLGKFLATCAKQFAFGKIFRISHGAVSPSNLTIDGLWLDLTNATFVPTTQNYCASNDTIPFLGEPRAIIDIVEQQVYHYCKYNQLELNIAPLINYYLQQFDAYMAHYIVSLFGLQPSIASTNENSAQRAILVKSYLCVVEQNKYPIVGFPNIQQQTDPIIKYLEQFFLLLSEHVRHESDNVMALGTIIDQVLISTYKSIDFDKLLRICCIKSLRKALFSPIFFIGQIHQAAKALLLNHNDDAIAPHIEQYRDVSQWLFEESEDTSVTLFRSSFLNIGYNAFEDRYFIQELKTKKSLIVKSAKELIEQTNKYHNRYFVIGGYNCKSNLIRLMTLLTRIEANIVKKYEFGCV